MRRSHLISLILVVAMSASAFVAVLSAGWAPVLGVQLQGGVEVVLRPANEVSEEQFERAIEIIRNRVDAIGVAEPDITRQGNQVVIQLPGVKDKQRAVDLVGQTAALEFRPVAGIYPAETNPTDLGLSSESLALLTDLDGDSLTELTLLDILTDSNGDEDTVDSEVLFTDKAGAYVYFLNASELTGDAVENAAATFEGQWIVNVEFNDEGSAGFDQMASAYFGQQVAIALDGVVESSPTINAQEFGGTAVISGSFTEQEAKDLALVLRFGALPVEFEQDDVRTVSATLGDGTLRAGVIAGIVGLGLVALYMLFYYKLLGLVAVCSLAISGSILWSIIAWLGERQGLALTLAGATGIIVSIGVQVDSNIVYYERIKEEVRRGRAVRTAADKTFSGAFSTIVWADLASLISAAVLYQLTTGTVRGFALYLGIATLIDIAVSYFFMRPLVVVIARKLVGEKPKRIGMSHIDAEVTQ